jgi:phage gp29-like protein
VAEVGVSGTPIFGGFLRERGEYNPDFQGGPFSSFQTFEQMRRGDAQVAATLMAMKLPIRSAQWNVVVSPSASPAEKEAAAFVKKCLFEDQDFTAILRNALLMLDFGVSAHEDVWEVRNGRVVWKTLAPRLPLTFFRWIMTPNGQDLAALEQLGYQGSEYKTTQVPADKLALFTFDQEGQNFAGRSVLRPMYQSWWLKSGLHKIDAIATERNGTGVPVISMGPNASTEDKKAALQWVEQLAAHQRSGMVLPPGWNFELHGVKGKTRDPRDSIEHHNMQISMAGLAMFMQLGQTHGGNRALGDTMTDFFYLALEATSQQIGRVLTMGSVKRLVDFNFEGIVNYPRVSPQQIMTVKFEAIVSALKDLAGVGVIQPDPSLENWMREKIGAPKLETSLGKG